MPAEPTKDLDELKGDQVDLAGNVLCRVLAQKKTNDGAMHIFRLGIKQQEWRSFGRQGPQASAAEDLRPKVSYLTFLLEFHVLCIVLKYSKTDSATSPMTEKTLAPLRPKGWRSTYPTCSKTMSCVQVRSRLNVKLHFLVKKATNERSQKSNTGFFFAILAKVLAKESRKLSQYLRDIFLQYLHICFYELLIFCK